LTRSVTLFRRLQILHIAHIVLDCSRVCVSKIPRLCKLHVVALLLRVRYLCLCPLRRRSERFTRLTLCCALLLLVRPFRRATSNRNTIDNTEHELTSYSSPQTGNQYVIEYLCHCL